MSLLYAKAPAGRAGEAVGVRSVVLNASHTVLPLAFGGVGAALGMIAGVLDHGGGARRRRLRSPTAGAARRGAPSGAVSCRTAQSRQVLLLKCDFRDSGDAPMPIYEYRCASCGHQQEFLQKVSDAPLTVCTAVRQGRRSPRCSPRPASS